MPGHEAVMGNERADEEVKKSAGSDSSLQQLLLALCSRELLISQSSVRQYHLKKVKAKLRELFECSPRCQWVHCIDPSMPSSRFRKDTAKIEHWQASMLVQLRTGHLPLQKHLNWIGCMSSPTCLACCMANETVYHYLMVCPVYRSHRKQMEY